MAVEKQYALAHRFPESLWKQAIAFFEGAAVTDIASIPSTRPAAKTVPVRARCSGERVVRVGHVGTHDDDGLQKPETGDKEPTEPASAPSESAAPTTAAEPEAARPATAPRSNSKTGSSPLHHRRTNSTGDSKQSDNATTTVAAAAATATATPSSTGAPATLPHAVPPPPPTLPRDTKQLKKVGSVTRSKPPVSPRYRCCSLCLVRSD